MEFLKILEILLRRKWTVLSVLFFFSVAFTLAGLVISPSYQAESKLFINPSAALSSLKNELAMDQKSSIDSSEEDIFETKTALAKVRPLLEELISSLQLKDRDNETIEYDDLLDAGLFSKLFPQPSVAIKQYEDTAMLTITSTSPNAVEAAEISNKLALLYINHGINRAQEEFTEVKTFLDEKLSGLYNNYDISLKKLTDFRINEHATDLAGEQGNTISRLNDLEINYEDNEHSLVLLNKEITTSEEQLRKVTKYRKEVKEFSRSNEIISLQGKLNDLFINISSQSIIYQKNHPEYQLINKELEAVKKLIKNSKDITLNRENFSIDPVYDSLSARLVNLYINREIGRAKSVLLLDSITEYEEKVARFPAKSAELAKLELAMTVKRNLYESFLTYINKVEIAETVALSDIRLVESAEVPEKQTFPKKVLCCILGIFLGCFWGATTAFFFEYIDNTVHSPADIYTDHYDKINIIGNIPKSGRLKKRKLLSNRPSDIALAERYRTIRHNIRFTSSKKNIKSIVVTSCQQREGKSCFAVHFARSLAGTTKKILLLDLNLRQPEIHRYFSQHNEKGIADIIRQQQDIQEALVSTSMPGLDILPAGTVKGGPGDVVDAENFPDLLHSLEKLYDVIVIDTPSLQSGSDALFIGTITDYLICLVACDSTPRSSFEQGYRQLQKAGIQQVGFVVNKFNETALHTRISTVAPSGGSYCG